MTEAVWLAKIIKISWVDEKIIKRLYLRPLPIYKQGKCDTVSTSAGGGRLEGGDHRGCGTWVGAVEIVEEPPEETKYGALGSDRHRVNPIIIVVAMLHRCSHLEATRDIKNTWRKEKAWSAVEERSVVNTVN